MGIWCQIIFMKLRFWKINELETLGTRQGILQKKKLGNVAVLESIQSRFEFSIHLSVMSFPRTSREYIENVWKVQNTTGRFLAPLHPSNFVRKILCLVPKVSNSWIVQKRSFMTIIWHRISIQTLLFQDAFAYPSKWRRKPWQGL